MSRVRKKHDLCESYDRRISPRVMRKIEKLKDSSRLWQACAAGNGKYSVYHGFEGYVVSIVEKTCTCRAWELSGIPCLHTIAVMREERQKVEDFIHEFYSIDKYRKAFAYAVNPINGHNLWVKQDLPTFLPPHFDFSMKNLAFNRGPKEGGHRKKHFDSSGKFSRKGHKKTCSKCGVVGHSKTTCNKQVLILFLGGEGWFLVVAISLKALDPTNSWLYHCAG